MHKTNLKCVYLLKLQHNNELLKRLILLRFMTLLSRLFHTGITLSLKKMFANVQSRVG